MRGTSVVRPITREPRSIEFEFVKRAHRVRAQACQASRRRGGRYPRRRHRPDSAYPTEEVCGRVGVGVPLPLRRPSRSNRCSRPSPRSVNSPRSLDESNSPGRAALYKALGLTVQYRRIGATEEVKLTSTLRSVDLEQVIANGNSTNFQVTSLRGVNPGSCRRTDRQPKSTPRARGSFWSEIRQTG
jgi:hypothetical protein